MPSPTIVLVHGAFGDASSWRPVYDRLVGDGHAVLAPPNPLRGIPHDASFTASVIDQIEGPVVLVGHSYGGAVITVAGSSDKVAGLVYVAGVAPDEGESVNDLQARFPSLAMGPLVRPAQLTDGSVEVSIDPARFHDVFCADVPDADAAFMAISQRPVSATAFDDPATAAAWRTKPSWATNRLPWGCPAPTARRTSTLFSPPCPPPTGCGSRSHRPRHPPTIPRRALDERPASRPLPAPALPPRSHPGRAARPRRRRSG